MPERLTKDGLNSHQCDVCQTIFSSGKLLRRHMKQTNKHSDKKYVCRLCDRPFARKDALKRHELNNSCYSINAIKAV